jgi:cysteine desulfuration protein SufE
VLIRLLNDLPYSEIQDFSIRDALTRLGLDEALSSQRTNGLMSMVERLKRATA